MNTINKISQEQRLRLNNKSAQLLPNSPTAKGITPQTIRNSITKPLFDDVDSFYYHFNRMADEINANIEEFNDTPFAYTNVANTFTATQTFGSINVSYENVGSSNIGSATIQQLTASYKAVVPTSSNSNEAVNNARMTSYVGMVMSSFYTAQYVDGNFLRKADADDFITSLGFIKEGGGGDLGDLPERVDALETDMSTVQSNLDDVTSDVEDIKDVIPNGASSTNQLADKDFVNSSIATNTSNFITTQDVRALGLTQTATHQQVEQGLNTFFSSNVTNNDYAFVYFSDSEDNIVRYERYKYKASQLTWKYEFTLNNSSFTSAQWEAINSGITASKVSEITANTSARHTHSNKSVLDTITQAMLNGFADKYTKQEADAKYQTIAGMSSYASYTYVDEAIEDLDDKIDDITNSYLTKNEATNTYQTKTDMSTYALKTYVDSAIATAITSTLGGNY